MTINRARAMALLAAGTALSPPMARAQTKPAALRVAITPSADAAEIFYAADNGFFMKAGLDVDIQTLQSNPAVASAVASGAVDIGHGAIDTVAAMHSKNIPVVVIAPGGEYVTPAVMHLSGLAVPLDSPVRSARDLNGKVVGVVSLHGLTETAARVWIDQNGGDSSTIKYVEIPFPSMAAALEAHRVDAVSTADPYMAATAKVGRFLSYGLDGVGKHFIIASWFATPQWVKANSDVSNRFAAVMRDTAIWANRNPAKVDAILAKRTGMDAALVATMTRTHFAEQMTPALVQPLIDAAAKYNGFPTFPSQEILANPSH